MDGSDGDIFLSGDRTKGSHWRITVRRCGASVRYSVNSIKDGGWRDASADDAERKRLYVIFRAIQNLRDRVLVLGADRMITLTYQENMQDMAVAIRHLKAFVKGVRKKYKKFLFVAVAELQKRGAIHWHIAVRGYYDAPYFMLPLWRGIIGGLGSVHITPPRKFGNSMQIAFYIGKYMGKGWEDGERPKYKHLYLVSRGLKPDISKLRLYGANSDEMVAWLQARVRAEGKSVVHASFNMPYREQGSVLAYPLRPAAAPYRGGR
ncbi:MAG TPA: hypothetical protein VHE58_00460 [Burkholderiales bacterium]|nr:hypothetical protein [Burkholderiales bacterium]